AISRISAIPSSDGQSIAFRMNVEGDPSAGVQQVWITYTAATPACSGGANPCAGQWQPLDLVRDAADSTLWTGTPPLAGTAASNVRYLVQAVNGAGVVGTATNLGAYYVPQVEAVQASAPKQSTSVSFSAAPSSGTYRDAATFTAVLTSYGSPVNGRPLVFKFGPQRLQAVTDADGSATVTFALLQTPGQYPVRAGFEEAHDLLGSAADSTFSIALQNTTLTLTGGNAHYSDSTGVVATLADQSAPTPRRLREQTVMFIVSQGQSSWVVPVITDALGRAPLGPLPLAPGAYTVAAYLSGTIQVPTRTGVVPPTPSPSLPAGLYRVESSVAGGFYSSPTTSVSLVVFDPSLAVKAKGVVPTTAPPPNNTATFGLKVNYGSTGIKPAGKLKFVQGVPGDDAEGVPDDALWPTDDTQVAAGTPCQAGVVDPNAGVDFRSTAFDWLVISGSIVQVQGVGTINGCGSYHFRVIATQVDLAPDTFEIHVWDAAHSFDTPLLLASGTLSSGQITIAPSGT